MLKDKKYRRGLETSLADENSIEEEEYDEEGSTLENLDVTEYMTERPIEEETATSNIIISSSTEPEVSVFKKILWNSFMKKIEMREVK